MGPAVKRSGGGVLEGMYRMIMRRTPIYVTFVVVGAFLGERVSIYLCIFIDLYNYICVCTFGLSRICEYEKSEC
ncbi:hypothetical protein ACJIZ3_017366 [Penstemon smallii]|uniref:Complex III subunit 9 n=1 Tax=Penstemon smallii TaxID=265156 RepID=A0ABD3SVD0_9LAMI